MKNMLKIAAIMLLISMDMIHAGKEVTFENRSRMTVNALPVPSVSVPQVMASSPARGMQVKLNMPEDAIGLIITDNDLLQKVVLSKIYPPFKSAYDKNNALYDKAWKAYLRFAQENVKAFVESDATWKPIKIPNLGRTGDDPKSYDSWFVSRSISASGKDEMASWYDVLAQHYDKPAQKPMPPTSAYSLPGNSMYNFFGLVDPSKKWGAFETNLPATTTSFKFVLPMVIEY